MMPTIRGNLKETDVQVKKLISEIEKDFAISVLLAFRCIKCGLVTENMYDMYTHYVCVHLNEELT